MTTWFRGAILASILPSLCYIGNGNMVRESHRYIEVVESFIISEPSSRRLAGVTDPLVAGHVQVVEPELKSWLESPTGTATASVVVLIILLGGAYGFHVLRKRQMLRYRLALDQSVQQRTRELDKGYEELRKSCHELEETNAALRNSNSVLESANESLAWANAQLSHSNRMFEHRLKKLRKALETNKEILDITAHDLKNPLSGTIGIACILWEDLIAAPEFETRQHCIEHSLLLKSASEKMLFIVEELLDKHRKGLEATLYKERIDLNELVHEVIQWNHRQAAGKGITLNFLPSDGEIPVIVDISAMQRVADNLVSNAVKYTPLHTHVWVRTFIEGRVARVEIEDEGPGLTEQDKMRAFGRNVRLTAQPTAGEQSTGLGLYVVKQLIDQHNGEVGVDSTFGEGAVFWFEIDLADDVDEKAAEYLMPSVE